MKIVKEKPEKKVKKKAGRKSIDPNKKKLQIMICIRKDLVDMFGGKKQMQQFLLKFIDSHKSIK